MIFLYVLLILLILLLCYFFFAPFYLEIDTERDLYRIRFHRLISISFLAEPDPTIVVIKFLFWEKRLSLKAGRTTNSSTKSKNTPIIRKNKTNFSLEKMLNILKSFKVNFLYLTIDTGNMQTNGIFYPLFYLLGAKNNWDISINFMGKNELKLELQNSLARVSRAYIARDKK